MIKKTWFIYFLLLAVFITACKKDEEVINEAQVLAEYLESANSPYGKDFVNTDLPAIMPASEVKTLNETGKVYIIDLRSSTDFKAGHIPNAVNVPLSDIVNHIKTINMDNYTKVAVVCYTGQTSGFAVSLLRLLGYSKVFSMKFGMASWHADFAGKWQNNLSNAYATQFTSTPAEKGPKGNLPVLNTGKKTGQEILEARVNELLTAGFTPATLTAKNVFDNLSNYYIVNYWPVAHYNDPGHIPGAIQYTPKESIKLEADLKTLPTNKPVVVYCYTGQTSAFLIAYLRLLGYDARSILFGCSSMIYDIMLQKNLTTFKPSEIMGYDYVTSN